MFKLYEVDPDADTLLIVPAPTAPFAKWDESQKESTNGTLPNGYPHHEDHSVNGVNGLVNCVARVKLNGVKGSRSTVTPPSSPPSSSLSPELRIKVSSKHLSLASRHFGNKFKWKSADPASVQPDGRVHVTLETGVDPAAATIVMNIIHGRGHKVPRQVDLETLAKVAVFVDEYRCYDAVEAYADRWIGQLEKGAGLETYGRDLVFWIYISYVFHHAELFKRATAVAISQSTGPIPDLGLPIRDKVIKSIDNQRQELVVQAVTIIHDALLLNTDGSVHPSPCTIGCDSFLAGSLTQALSSKGISWPRPAKPFHGVGYAAVAEVVAQVEAQHERWHTVAGPIVAGGAAYSSKPRSIAGKRKTPNSPPSRASFSGCRSRLNLTPLLRDIEAEIGGLDLESSLGYYLY